MNKIEPIKLAKEIGVGVISGALSFITLGGSHYIYVCRENDKQLELIRNENEKQKLVFELQKKEIIEEIRKEKQKQWFL
jgi:hypothetical protein